MRFPPNAKKVTDGECVQNPLATNRYGEALPLGAAHAAHATAALYECVTVETGIQLANEEGYPIKLLQPLGLGAWSEEAIGVGCKYEIAASKMADTCAPFDEPHCNLWHHTFVITTRRVLPHTNR